MSRRHRPIHGLGIFNPGSPLTLPSIESLPDVTSSLPTSFPEGLLPGGPGGLSAPASPPSRGFDVNQTSVPMAKLEAGALRLLRAPQVVQLPPAQPDPRTIAVQRHVNFWLGHYGHALIPEDGRMGPLLCGAFALLDAGLPADYEAQHSATLAARGWFGRDRGMGYTAIFGMAGTPGRLMRDGCVLAGQFETPPVVKGPGMEASSGAGLPPPPTEQAPGIDALVDAAAAEVVRSPVIDAEVPPIDTGWGTLSLPAGSPLPAKTAGGTMPSGGGVTLPSTWPGGVPPKQPREPVMAASSVSTTSLVLIGLSAAALGALLLSGKKKRS